jgi:hypothetical protein
MRTTTARPNVGRFRFALNEVEPMEKDRGGELGFSIFIRYLRTTTVHRERSEAGRSRRKGRFLMSAKCNARRATGAEIQIRVINRFAPQETATFCDIRSCNDGLARYLDPPS